MASYSYPTTAKPRPLTDYTRPLQAKSFCTSKLRAFQPHPRATSSQAFAALEWAEAWSVPVLTKTTQRCAILSLGGGAHVSDLTNYCTHFGLPTPKLNIFQLLGATNNYTGNPQSADLENALDVQNVAGITRGRVDIDFYCLPNSADGIIAWLKALLKDLPAVGVSCWGAPESLYPVGAKATINSLLQSLAHSGVPIPIADGDDGSGDGQMGLNVDFMAASPWALAVGGVSRLPSGIFQAWPSGGGGFSRGFLAQPWATAFGVRRALPDVAGPADPASCASLVTLAGSWQVAGGTSAAAPLWAGLLAALVSATGQRFYELSKWLYGLTGTEALTDITSGSNGAYTALIGQDLCTGLGVPNRLALTALQSKLAATVKPATPAPAAIQTPPAPLAYVPGEPTRGVIYDGGNNPLWTFPLNAAKT